jgi:hypothetical protein
MLVSVFAHFFPPFFPPAPPADLAAAAAFAARPAALSAAFAVPPAALPAVRAALPVALPACEVAFLACLVAAVRAGRFLPLSGRSNSAAVGLTLPTNPATVSLAESAALDARSATSPAMRRVVLRAPSVASADRSIAPLAVSAEERTVLLRLRLLAMLSPPSSSGKL